jgi:hypothetical protein
MPEPFKNAGFAVPQGSAVVRESRAAALAAIAGLTISTVIAVTAITVGAAHAGVVDGVVDNEGSVFAVALVLGLVFIGVGGFSLLPPGRRRRPH